MSTFIIYKQGPIGPKGDVGSANISGTTNKLIKFTSSTTGEDSIISEVSETIIISGSISITGKTNYGTTLNGVWKDLITPLIPPNVGVTIPTVTQIGSSSINAPLWAINDQMWVFWHMQHDLALGTAVYMHVHWLSDGTNTNTVKWEFTYYHSKGHNQATFVLGGAGTTTTAEQAASGTAFKHMITESTAVSISGLEPDSVIMCRIRRISNGGTNNTDNIFGFMADIHYQADTPGTKNRVPNFYT